MEDPKEGLTTCIATAELERMWKAARRGMMRENKIDFLPIGAGVGPCLHETPGEIIAV